MACIPAAEILLTIVLSCFNLQTRAVKRKTDGEAKGVDPLLISGPSKEASATAREIQIYGRIQDVTGRTLHEFDAALNADPDKTGGLLIYQRPIVLAAGTYKLELAVRESESDLFGTHEERLQVPGPIDGLTVGPLMLAQEIVPVARADDVPRPFELGDIRVIPRLDTHFARDEVLKLYFQAYNFELDVKSGQPAFSLVYYILQEGKQIKNFRDGSASSLQSASPESAVFASGINLKVLEPGNYRLIVRVKDKISGQEASSSVEFSVS